MQCDLLLVNGYVVTHQKTEPRDIAIHHGKFLEIGDRLTTKYQAKEIHDLKDLYIMPGLMDTQVHFREPGMTHKEDIETGSMGSLMGGLTAFLEMPNTNPPTLDEKAIKYKIELARKKSYTHFGFFMGASSNNLGELKKIPEIKGCVGIKIFFGSSTGNLLLNDEEKILQIFKQTSCPIAIHSEDENILRERISIRDNGKNAHAHLAWRNVESALSATQKIIRLAKMANRKIHLLHITSKDEIEFLSVHKKYCTVEILPQHLILHAPDCYDRLGNYAQMNPPIREKIHRDALLSALQKGIVDVMASDHAPHTKDEKNLAYPASPSGLPGTQTLVPLMLNFVNMGYITLPEVVRLLSYNPSQIYSLSQKGEIAPDLDADLTVVDLSKKVIIANDMIKSRVAYTPFHGLEVTGYPVAVYLLGNLAMKNGKLIGRPQGECVN